MTSVADSNLLINLNLRRFYRNINLVHVLKDPVGLSTVLRFPETEYF